MRGEINQAVHFQGESNKFIVISPGLIRKPRCLMLDEPSSGLVSFLVAEVFSILKGVKERGLTLLFVEQNARQVLDLANRAYGMEVHWIIAEGATKRY